MAEPLTPVDIERMMGEALEQIKERIETVRKARDDFAAAKRTLRVKAGTYMAEHKTGTRADREDQAYIDCQQFVVALDTTEVTMKYSQDLLGVAEKELSALQTVAKLVLQAYNVAGR